MKLCYQTLLPPDATRLITLGSFTRPKQQEIVAVRGSHLVVYSLSSKRGRLHTLFHHNLFAEVRALTTFRLPGSRTDYVVLTSDAGSLSVLLADLASRTFKIVHCEAFGKSGCRPNIPGQYLVSDPRGRAVCIGALENTKFAYLLNRESGLHPSVSSPLEVHKSNSVTYALTSVDVGFENPMFASIEQIFGSPDRFLVWYEIELGLNQIIRRRQDPIEQGAYRLIAIPGYTDGPGGVLVISTGAVTYATYEDQYTGTTRPQLHCRFPLYPSEKEGEVFICATALYHGRKKNPFFVLLCSELGNLLKVDLINGHSPAAELRVGYFDHVPGPLNSLCILRSGFIAASLEGGGLHLYRIKKLDVDIYATSENFENPAQLENGDLSHSEVRYAPEVDHERVEKTFTYDERSSSTTLSVSGNSSKDAVLLLGSGLGQEGRLRALKPGIAVDVMLEGHQLRYTVEDIFAFRESLNESMDRFVVVTNRSSTKVLRIGDELAQETDELMFETNVRTIASGIVGGERHLQVHAKAARVTSHVQHSFCEWKPPQSHQIRAASFHGEQLVVILSSGKIIYLEVSSNTGYIPDKIHELENAFSISGDSQISNETSVRVSMQQSADFTRRVRFFGAAVGNRVRLFKVSNKEITPLGLYLASDAVSDILLTEIGSSDSAYSSTEKSHLLCGTIAGHVTRLSVDLSTGNMAEKFSTVQSNDAVHFVSLKTGSVSMCIIGGKRPLALFCVSGRIEVAPLGVSQFESAASFSGQEEKFGFVSTSSSGMAISYLRHSDTLTQASQFPEGLSRLAIPAGVSLHCQFQQFVHKLEGTPYHIIPFTVSKQHIEGLDKCELALVSVRLLDENKRDARLSSKVFLVEVGGKEAGGPSELLHTNSNEIKVHDAMSFPSPTVYVALLKESDNNISVIVGHEAPGKEQARVEVMTSSQKPESALHTFSLTQENKLALCHITTVTGCISALIQFRGFVLGGFDRSIKYFGIGIKKLLLKGQSKNIVRHKVIALSAAGGDRVFLADVMDSVSLLRYEERQEFGGAVGSFTQLASEKSSRWVSKLYVLDYNTVSGCDKFGNLFILRLMPHSQSDLGHFLKSHRLDVEASFHVGSAVLGLCNIGGNPIAQYENGIQTRSMPEKGKSRVALIFCCSDGSVGMLAPVPSSSDNKLVEGLERKLRDVHISPCGRRHQAYRSAFYPVKNVVDLDFCELFFQLQAHEQKGVAEKLDMSVPLLLRKLQQTISRNRALVIES